MGSLLTFESGVVWVGAFFTLCIYSFLYKENPFYRFAEHAVVGASVGYMIVMAYYNVIKPYWWENFLKGMFVRHEAYAFGLIPAALVGLLWLTRLIPKVAWMSRYPIAISVGFSSGYAIPITIQASILVHLRATWANMLIRDDGGHLLLKATIYGVIIFMGVISVLCYFFFSKAHTGLYGYFTQLGIWFLMVSFGASFGYTVMARISLFIGRLQFLFTDWLGILH
ncbi:hypothetical protein JW905_12590 [bacterium]|nr:hypothetical protein [candidate division CSSED10-310 bacterium]